MFEVINFDSWHEYDGFSEGSGRSEKIWLISDEQKIGLFKFPKIDPDVNRPTTEHISEHLAHQLGKLLDVPTAKVDLGTRNGRIGCMSYLVCAPKETLVEGINFISGEYPKYNTDTMYDEANGKYYCMEHIFRSVPKVIPKQIWIEMMLFDYLIENTDRHHSNWALLMSVSIDEIDKKVALHLSQCPLYDNGSSLCCYVNDTQISKYNSKDVRTFNALVDSKSRSIIRIDGTVKRTPTHKDVVKYLLDVYPVTEKIARRFIQRINKTAIDELLEQYPDNLICHQKRELISRYLIKKIDLLQDLLMERVGNSETE